jgi:serine/threonine-protein kinase
VHRDVKPDNVLFSGAGVVKVADFGLAAVLGSGSQLTEHGFVVGTPHYMSPEQCGGDPVDARSDIYSLGATMYHTLTGSEPFGGDSPMSVMLKHRSEPVRPPNKVNPDVPKDLSDLVLKAMAKNPNDRFQDADSLVAALMELPASRKD